MGAEVHSALYGTRDWAGKRATLERTLSTPSNCAFPPKISHPKGFHNTILDSPTTVSLRRSNEQIREHRTAAGIYDGRQLKTAPASLTGARRRCLCGTGTEKEERQTERQERKQTERQEGKQD